MAALSNTRHEQVVQLVACEGVDWSKAWFFIYGGANINSAAAVCSAIKNSDPRIMERYRELKGEIAEAAVFGAVEMAAQFDEDRDFARQLFNPSAAVAASGWKAKVFGLATDVVKHGGEVRVKHGIDELYAEFDE